MRVTEVLEEKPKIEEGLLTPRIPFGMTSLFFDEQRGVRGVRREIENRREKRDSLAARTALGMTVVALMVKDKCHGER